MIVVFEGLSCVGKTSLINYLQSVTDCFVVQEWASVLDSVDVSIERKCQLNDLYKTAAVRNSSELRLVDRYYPSTLACRFSESSSSIGDFIATAKIDEYFEPDLWVYIYEDVNQSITRAALHRSGDGSPWFNFEQAQDIVRFYDSFFEFKPNVIRLSSCSVHSFLLRSDR